MGLLHCYTGDGKGKTTAAFGLALRAAGSGMRVFVCQFLKDGTSSELKPLAQIENIIVFPAHKSLGFIKYMSEEKKKEAMAYYRGYFATICEASKGFDMIVIDECMPAYNFDMIDKAEMLIFLKERIAESEIVLTGRDVPKEIIEIADYVTECRKIKHPFDEGIQARFGIEL